MEKLNVSCLGPMLHNAFGAALPKACVKARGSTKLSGFVYVFQTVSPMFES